MQDRSVLRQPRLAGPPLHLRMLGAVAAVAATGLLVFGLDRTPAPATALREPAELPPIVVLLPPLRIEPAPPIAADTPVSAERRRPRKPVQAAPIPSNRVQPQSVTPPTIRLVPLPEPAPALPERAALAEPAASAANGQTPPRRLQLDAEVLRSAASVSRGRVMSMAEASGRGIDDSSRSAQSRWTRAVGSAGRADCLAADDQASLLSAFSIVARAVSGKCP